MSPTVAVAPATETGGADDILLALGRRDGQVAIAALVVGSTAAWLYLAFGIRTAAGMKHSMGSMTAMSAWTPGEAAIQALMWVVMMVAMMLPAAIPATLVYLAVGRKASRQGTPIAPASALVSGYIGVWLLFSGAATVSEWGLERLSLLSPSMTSNSARFGGAILVAAGVYQLTPLKSRCLKRCRDPGRLIADHWRRGSLGAVRMGAELGLYCLGCCWVLMALLFVGGVMNLLWVAAIATYILLEKIAPLAQAWGRLVGMALVVGGAFAALG